MPQFSVAKFGGTSVANLEAMQACADILQDDPNTRVVVLSASAGVTNLLVALAEGCDVAKREKLLNELVSIQQNILENLPNCDLIQNKISELLVKIKSLSEAAALATSLALTDELISQGEMISSLIFVHLLKQQGCDAVWMDVREIIATDSHFGKATPIDDKTQANSDRLLLPLVKQGKLIVTQGFIGRESEGRTTTLGRGGSDYSAALLAEVLGAKDVRIWTDVAGIYTTDPRLVPTAKRMDNITFAEAAEMATFGAKVLHPATLRPAVRSNIPVFVGSSKNPEALGTWVTQTTECSPTFRAIAVRREQTLLTLANMNMWKTKEFLSRVFAILEKHNIAIDAISTSEISVALILDKITTPCGKESPAYLALLSELSTVASVKVTSGLSLIALVGNNMQPSESLSQQIFTILAGFHLRMVNFGASANNICLLVPEDQTTHIVQTLHQRLFEEK